MEKESNYLSSVVFLCGSLFSSGVYLAASSFFPPIAGIFFLLTTVLAVLGIVKLLNHYAPSLPLFLKRAAHWLHSLVFETFAIMTTFFMRPLGFIKKVQKRCGSEKGRPILLIHGYLQNASNWAFLKRELCQRGFGPIYTLNLSPTFRSIRAYTQLVSQKAFSIAQETKRSDLVLIGHSMGGLVSAWYAAKVAEPGKVTDVITIGSPLAGTKLAALAIGQNGREMRCGSDLVRELKEEFLHNHTTRFFHIASKADQIIIPYSSALVGLNPHREYLIEDLGHMSLLFSSRVADKIEEWLKTPRQKF